MLNPGPVFQISLAGIHYLIIIVAGLGAELGLRGSLIDLADAETTATAILVAPGQFRLAIAADLIMTLCDAGLAILLYLIFRSIAPGLARSAMVFRLIQIVLIAANLMAMQAAWLLISGGTEITDAVALAQIFLDLHGHGYDFGLVFFGVNSLIVGMLVWRSGVFARVLGTGLAAAGQIYLTGSALRFFAPDLSAAFMPACCTARLPLAPGKELGQWPWHATVKFHDRGALLKGIFPIGQDLARGRLLLRQLRHLRQMPRWVG